jgi:hypothetical protein
MSPMGWITVILLLIVAAYGIDTHLAIKRFEKRTDDALDRLADDGNPLASETPETNIERAARFRRAAAKAREEAES